ncbi:MAG: hypothetical protein QMD00_04155 [Hadesarchaea archaeon]|nr:hypothetical protein [Hadesarchaea archaeon]
MKTESGTDDMRQETKNVGSHVPPEWRQMQSLVEELVVPAKLGMETQGFLVQLITGIQDGK